MLQQLGKVPLSRSWSVLYGCGRLNAGCGSLNKFAREQRSIEFVLDFACALRIIAAELL